MKNQKLHTVVAGILLVGTLAVPTLANAPQQPPQDSTAPSASARAEQFEKRYRMLMVYCSTAFGVLQKANG